ncbi:hypothetical protein SAE02_72760 [Skermanella aerolata]|uniref:Uncharacterized protein n=1 Tax=Skermanella aerolata TaxID=393310 RepID=A0A512E332_9PROT|nr:hypothetical protein [Skermanella aerolata]KJB90266.1 hypothetical protein N826_38835 [Skermanella aerolata KACC 11604]GEO43128.1 hypothetical protein SAE02_72760 [Skermanella aerolata]
MPVGDLLTVKTAQAEPEVRDLIDDATYAKLLSFAGDDGEGEADYLLGTYLLDNIERLGRSNRETNIRKILSLPNRAIRHGSMLEHVGLAKFYSEISEDPGAGSEAAFHAAVAMAVVPEDQRFKDGMDAFLMREILTAYQRSGNGSPGIADRISRTISRGGLEQLP